jgi:hypothetical protein
MLGAFRKGHFRGNADRESRDESPNQELRLQHFENPLILVALQFWQASSSYE